MANINVICLVIVAIVLPVIVPHSKSCTVNVELKLSIRQCRAVLNVRRVVNRVLGNILVIIHHNIIVIRHPIVLHVCCSPPNGVTDNTNNVKPSPVLRLVSVVASAVINHCLAVAINASRAVMRVLVNSQARFANKAVQYYAPPAFIVVVLLAMRVHVLTINAKRW